MTLTLKPPVTMSRWTRAGSMIFLAIVMASVGVALADSVLGRLTAIIIAFVLAVRWPVGRIIAAMFVMFVAVDDAAANPYNGLWKSPVQHVGDFWFSTISKSVPFLPIPVAPMVLVSVIVAWRAATGRTGRGLRRQEFAYTLPRTFGHAWVGAFAVIPVLAFWGVATGGSTQQIYYQVFGIVIALCLAGATARVTDPVLSSLIWKIVLFSAL